MPTARARLIRVVAALAAGGAALLVAWVLRPDDPSGLPPCTATSEEIAPPVTSRFLPPDLRIDDDPIEVAVTADGRLWFGSEYDGMAVYDGAGFQLYTPQDGLAGWEVKQMIQDFEGVYWLGTENGLSRITG